MKLKILTESLPIRLLFFIALSLFPPRVTILPYFFRYMVIFYFFTLLVIWPVSGTVQSVVCCTSAPRPAQRVRDGQIYGEWKEYFNTFHKPWREEILFLSYIFKRNGAVKSATSSFLPIRAGGSHRVNPHQEADKQGSRSASTLCGSRAKIESLTLENELFCIVF